MRRFVFSVIVASGLIVAGSSPALADDPAPTVSVQATAGKKICKVTNTTLDELSGIVATKTGFVVIDDGSTQSSHKKVFFLDDKCQVTKKLDYSGDGPLDTEDMILSPDGQTIWIADTGDDGVRAATPTHRERGIALWTMKADGSEEPVLHRLAYPEGDYHDAEALLLQGNATPLIITKELGKPASIYEPTGPLKTRNSVGVPLRKVGEITVSATTTPSNTVAEIGNKTIDGAAIAPGGKRVALRTYTDALEWDVTNGDVLTALKGKPRTTGLPNEPFGEAITYSPDGKYFYTVSDMNGDHDTANYILQYTPATTVAVAKQVSTSSSSTTHWYSNLTINQITLMVAAVGLIGLILVGVGVLGIVRSRKRAAADPGGGYGGLDDSPNPETELIGVGGAPQRGVYGARSGAVPPAGGGNGGGSGAVYGAGQGPGQRSGPVYGAGGGAPQYARPPGGQQPPRGGQQPPQRGGQQPPQRGGQQPPQRAGQQPPAGGGQQPPARGGQQPPARGGQPPRGPQPPGRNGAYGGGQQSGPAGGQGGQGRGAAPQGQRPQGMPPGGGGGRPQQGPGQRPPGGTYGQGGGQGGGQGRPPRDDGYAEYAARPEGRFDNPGYRR